mgnify:CR=1 FL=1
MIIIMFGPNAVGKSTSAQELAGRSKRGAYVEADLLKYLVAGGLVAWSAGLRPRKHPEEYRAQISLRNKNAAVLACNFDDSGFDCVVEGLDRETEGPGTGWAKENLVGHDVRYVAVVCDPEIAMQRLLKRDGHTQEISEYIEWQEEVSRADSGFDYVMDTSALSIHDGVSECAAALDIETTETASAMGVEWEIVKYE